MTGDGLAVFDRLIGDLRTQADQIAGGAPADDGGEGDEEDEARSLAPVPDQPIAAAPVAEPPPNPEDDPLLVLMTQTIAGQIAEKGLGENPDVRETIERHAKQLLPQVRELYPGGIQKAELERISALGTESDRKKFRPGEVVTGVLLERHLGTSLERASHIGDDWIDPRTNTTYDGVLGNMPPEHYSLKGARTSIIDHVRKATGKIVVDIHQLTDAQKKEVKDFVNTELPAEQFAKIIILE